MKTLFPGSTLVAGVLATVLGFAVTVPSATMRAADAEHQPATEVKAGSFASPADAWKAAQDATKEVETQVASKNLQAVHPAQEKLAGALANLQQNAGTSPDKARLTGALKNAITASNKLHESSDAGDQAKTEANLKTLKATLLLVERRLPAAGAR